MESKVQTVPFRVWALDVLKKRFAALDVSTRSQVIALLKAKNCWTGVLEQPILNAPSSDDAPGTVDPPFCTGKKPLDTISALVYGTSPKWSQTALAERVLKEQGPAAIRILATGIAIVLIQRWWRKS